MSSIFFNLLGVFVCGDGECMKYFVLVICIMMVAPVHAQVAVASQNYVNTATADKVSTSATANQTMAGNYVVSGSFKVPTPPLPSAE
mgnify:CR=1 FL=1